MNRISLILKNKIPALLFLIVAVIGAILIFWYLNSTRQSDHTDEVIEQNQGLENEEQNVIGDYGIILDDLSNRIPPGKKSVNLPVSFFGDHSILKIGDRVDIISTCYDKESGELYAKMILSGKKIIDIEPGQDINENSSGSISSSIFPETSFGTDISREISRTLVITYFIGDEEVMNSFMAIESGMLYLALCHGNDANIEY